MKKKILFAGIMALVLGSTLVGCSNTTLKERAYTSELMNISDDIVGKPNVHNYFEKGVLKDIYEMRDNPELVCYWYTTNIYSGKYVYQGKCVGFGIPYSTSYTQPETLAGREIQSSVVPQADPNALYSNGVTTSATWILVYDENGELKPRYVEPEITVSTTKIDKRLCEDWSLTPDY